MPNLNDKEKKAIEGLIENTAKIICRKEPCNYLKNHGECSEVCADYKLIYSDLAKQILGQPNLYVIFSKEKIYWARLVDSINKTKDAKLLLLADAIKELDNEL